VKRSGNGYGSGEIDVGSLVRGIVGFDFGRVVLLHLIGGDRILRRLRRGYCVRNRRGCCEPRSRLIVHEFCDVWN